jgi:hypothetical protein
LQRFGRDVETGKPIRAVVARTPGDAYGSSTLQVRRVALTRRPARAEAGKQRGVQTRLLSAQSPGDLDEAAELLRGGGLVAFPTETVYRLGGLALERAAPFDPRSLGMSGAVRFGGGRGALAGASARRSRPALAERVQSLPSRQHRDELRNPCRTGLGLLGGLQPVEDRVAVGSVELIEER